VQFILKFSSLHVALGIMELIKRLPGPLRTVYLPLQTAQHKQLCLRLMHVVA
jgi:hypothetical protein